MTQQKSGGGGTEQEPKGVKVPALRITQIRAIAERARELFDVQQAWVDVITLYERDLHRAGVVFDIAEQGEMDQDHGLTFPNQGVIQIREDVYEGAHANNGRDRYTMIHELGHLVLHDNVALSRSIGPHKWIEDSEWQADTFAAEFLMPVDLVRQLCQGPEDVARIFGVSRKAAETRWRKLQEQGLIKDDGAIRSRPIARVNR
ncbi:ImmA/IrrE family metallo-endopeptidase [Methylotetracoccus oryzae]|uniref:ImmA/IrrE family metallo-endopeptidase n=1 Tax=Methylotetracoccus oryzae TaxID=1919059 RepID=UPI00111B89F8|nr:ImmA/IrrE family metallo-endopeptidase [Methylotetracoccus oryzae]